MKTLIQDVTAIKMVKDRTGKASLFLFNDTRVLECHKWWISQALKEAPFTLFCN